jgi:hypothetical protein
MITGVSLVGGTVASTVTCEKRGGTVIEIHGNNFDDTAVIEIKSGAVTLGTGYIFDPVFDVTSTKLYVGLPAVAPGTYDLSVTVGVTSATLANALVYVLFAEDSKIHEARRGFSSAWRVGPRIFLNNTLDLGAL